MAPTALSKRTTETLDAIIKASTADPQHQLPRLVVMVASADSCLYAGAGGVEQLPPPEESITTPDTITPDSIFELWSCTKLVAAIAGLQLVERGQVGLHDDASHHLSALKDVKLFKGMGEDGEPILEKNDVPITMEMLIDHRAGFAMWYECPEYDAYLKRKGIPLDLRLRTLDQFMAMPLKYAPGTRWSYGPSNDWLTMVIEAVTGMTLQAYLDQNIFGPLGVRDMTYQRPSNKINFAFVPADPLAPYTVGPETLFTVHSGGAGLYGSPRSYLKIVQALLNGGVGSSGERILSSATVDTMFQPQLSSDKQREDLGYYAWSTTDAFTRSHETPPPVEWGYGGLIQLEGVEGGRRQNSLTWSGMGRTHWVIDREAGITFLLTPIVAASLVLIDSDVLLNGDKQTSSRRPTFTFLIKHPSGKLALWDLGFNKEWLSYIKPEKRNSYDDFEVDINDNLETMVKKGGVDPADISLVVLSHQHWDHTGEPSSYPNAEIIVGPTEHGAIPALAGLTNVTTLDWTTNPGKAVASFDHSYDVFDDGSFLIVDAKGHTPGHLCALIRTSKDEYALLGSDGCHHHLLLSQDPQHKDLQICTSFYTDSAESDRTLARMRACEKRDDCIVVIAHNEKQWDAWFKDEKYGWGPELNGWKEKGYKF
ncbi:beta-lactamase [Pseudohyphozyma bogoriensis]|nr:beta-lactamase [Pseudohyphozyma bogoriensis]